uniref:ribosomal protein L29 n=1 Tax=Timspurckia oligopyrenoides TaxID=708627 RepID=UPI001FCE0377|nr:ribosomal protein L29 [Timspurckia oligopyrenoides]UNJ17550.1 ribosomal protein L29 [Timspurckia oligopyrenoides]
MKSSNINKMRSLSEQEISEEIIKTKRQLLELRIQKATRQSLKPHLFKEIKHKLAHLLTVEQEYKNN